MSSQTPNINLTLPTGLERVSRQIINDNNTKIDTAIGTLNRKVSIYTITETSSLSALQTALETLAGTMENTTVKNIKFGLSTASAPISATTYYGTITRSSSTRFLVVANGTSTNQQDIVGLYNSGTWTWNSINSNIPRYKSFQFENVSVSAGTVGERGAQVSADLDITGYTSGIVMTYISDSTYAIPVPFISGNKMYVNFYRTSTSARTISVDVRITYFTT